MTKVFQIMIVDYVGMENEWIAVWWPFANFILFGLPACGSLY